MTKFPLFSTTRFIILVSTLIVTSAFASKQGNYDKSLIPNDTLVYKTLKKGVLKLYVFYPQGIKPNSPRKSNTQNTFKRPVVVNFFGGGWTGGNPKQFYQQCAFYAAHGMVAISADYRVKSRQNTTPFQCVEDGKSVIRWVRSHAELLGIDTTLVVASGGSAGGHVALCTALINGCNDSRDDLSISCVPNALILFNPVLDTTSKGYGAKKVKGKELVISPNHHIVKGLPPTILFHGTSDHTVPFSNATYFVGEMHKLGNICKFFPMKGEDHGFFNGHFFRAKSNNVNFDFTMKESLTFLKELNFVK